MTARIDRRQPGAGSIIAAAGVVLLLAAAFLVLRPGPASCPAPSVTIDVTVAAGAMTPSELSACRGQAVTLHLRSETDGIYHVHGLDAVLPATEIAAGDERTFEFTASQAGSFPVELHSDSGAASLGRLTVNVP